MRPEGGMKSLFIGGMTGRGRRRGSGAGDGCAGTPSCPHGRAARGPPAPDE